MPPRKKRPRVAAQEENKEMMPTPSSATKAPSAAANKRKRARQREQRLEQQRRREQMEGSDEDEESAAAAAGAVETVEAGGDLRMAPGRGFLTGEEAARAAAAFRAEEAAATEAFASVGYHDDEEASTATSAFVLFGLLRPVPGRWWTSQAAKANFFLSKEDLRELHGSGDSHKAPLEMAGAGPQAQQLLWRSTGVDGPLYEEAALLRHALRKCGGRRGFLQRRLEADRLHVELEKEVDAGDDDESGPAYPFRPLSLAARLTSARRAELAETKGIAWTAGVLIDTREAERWWTLPAALAGFNLRLADVKDLPRRRDQPPEPLAFDFGVLLRERELVALAQRLHGPDYSKLRRRARRREALVEEARRRIVDDVAEEGGGEEQGAVGMRGERDVVASLLCPLAHFRADDPGAAKRSLSSVTDLLGLKWVTRHMARALFGLTHEELDLLPRLPGLDPQEEGPEGDLFNERDLQQAANHTRAAGTPYGLARQGMTPAALHALVRKAAERRTWGVTAAAGPGEWEGGPTCPEAVARVLLGLEEEGVYLEGLQLEEEEAGTQGQRQEPRLPLHAAIERAMAKHGGDKGVGLLECRLRAETMLRAHAARRRTLRGLERLAAAATDDEEEEEEKEEEDVERAASALLASGELPILRAALPALLDEEGSDDEGEAPFRRLGMLRAMASRAYVPTGDVVPGGSKARLVWGGWGGGTEAACAVAARRLAGRMVQRYLSACEARSGALQRAVARVQAARAQGGLVSEGLGEEEEEGGGEGGTMAMTHVVVAEEEEEGRGGNGGERVLCVSRASSAPHDSQQQEQQQQQQQESAAPPTYKTVELRDSSGSLAPLLLETELRHGRGPRRPLTLCLHDSSPAPGQDRGGEKQPQPQCLPLSLVDIVRDRNAELLLVPEIDLDGVPPSIAALLEAAVSGLARQEYWAHMRRSAVQETTRRKAKKEKAKEKAKAAAAAAAAGGDEAGDAQQEAGIEGSGVGVPDVHALPPASLLPGPVCAAVREACRPLAAALRARRGWRVHSSSTNSCWLPGWVRVAGVPLLVTVDPVLVHELLGVLPPETLGAALLDELRGASPLLPPPAPGAAPAAAKPVAIALDDDTKGEGEQGGAACDDAWLLSELIRTLGQGEPRARALNQRLAAAGPPLLAVGDDGRPTPAVDWLHPLSAKAKQRQENRARLGCGQLPACAAGPLCRVCRCCLARHCGCGLGGSGLAPPHRAMGNAAWERDWHAGCVQAWANHAIHWSSRDVAAMNNPPPPPPPQPVSPPSERGAAAASLKGLTRGQIERLVAVGGGNGAEEDETVDLPPADLLDYIRATAAQKLQAPHLVAGQLDESALLALGVLVEEAVRSMLRRARARATEGVFCGVRALGWEYEDAARTLAAHLGPERASEEGEAAHAVRATVLRAVFGPVAPEEVEFVREMVDAEEDGD